MSGPSMRLRIPPASLFSWVPDAQPMAIPPPREARTFASPFPINVNTYHALLDWKVPLTIGAVYASTAIVMNRINRDRGNKPWAFSKTTGFYLFVLAHNIFLAIFSALTFVGMIRALAHTWPSRRELFLFGKYWPGLRTTNGLAGAVDALCKMHGPGVYGDAVFYNPVKADWDATNPMVKLAADGTPDPLNVGRLWNEGLAFWGWWFYLSKFYEVLDTFIILAKGKRSSTLQTYHHTGAMACMWAGIRFMSPPIWMFAFMNSGIHTLMYSYYTLSALHFKIPQRIKRTLTTMQIMQFLIGITFASLHLFVSYTIPVPTAQKLSQSVSSVASQASSAITSAAGAVATAGVGSWLMKVAFRAAGEEGIAEKVNSRSGTLAGSSGSEFGSNRSVRHQTKFHTEYQTVPCIYTNGQAFAIWLNVFYLAPLTVLFARFFVRSYLQRGPKQPPRRRRLSKAAIDAAEGVDRELDTLGKTAENGIGDLANNIMSRVHSHGDTTKGGDKRRVSANIERIANHFERSPEREIESPVEKSKTNGSLRTGSLRRQASAEHNNLRRIFEEGQAHIRSVDDSNPPTPESVRPKRVAAESPQRLLPFAKDTVMELERMAEEKVRGVREATGGQGSRIAGHEGNNPNDNDNNYDDKLEIEKVQGDDIESANSTEDVATAVNGEQNHQLERKDSLQPQESPLDPYMTAELESTSTSSSEEQQLPSSTPLTPPNTSTSTKNGNISSLITPSVKRQSSPQKSKIPILRSRSRSSKSLFSPTNPPNHKPSILTTPSRNGSSATVNFGYHGNGK